MLDFVAITREAMPRLRFLILTNQPDLAEGLLRQRREMRSLVLVRTAFSDDVPAYLAASDAGLCFLADVPSKVASSPTKYGEYLACGLPVVASGWVGDADDLEHEPAWVAVSAFNEEQYRLAANRLTELLRAREFAVTNARDLALRKFSLEDGVQRYHGLYQALLRSKL
jgi:glycosyltransferase involved in cell wall biosynthesis